MEKEVVLNILDELDEEDFKRFKFYLRECDIIKEKKVIPKARLENADRVDTVGLMVQTKPADVLEITKEVLIKINRNDLGQKIISIKGQSQKCIYIYIKN